MFPRLIAALLVCSVASADFPIFSCFGDSIPEVKLDRDAIIQTHSYLACVDMQRKQPRWVLYQVKRSHWETDNVLNRNFTTPQQFRAISLESSDYENSGYDLGHLYGLQFVSALPTAYEVNWLVAIAGQAADLNRGPWLKAENVIKAASETHTVNVISGCLWLDDVRRTLPHADEEHELGSHTWMIAKWADQEVAWLMPQEAGLADTEEMYRVDLAELRKKVSENWWDSSKQD